MPRNRYQPYVGESAFTHKGGLHASAVAKVEESYQHIDPSHVGNLKHIVVSELAGRSNIAIKLQEEGLSADVPKERLGDLLKIVTGSGGGFGNPKQRKKEHVLSDIENGFISKGDAEKIYNFKQ